MKWEPIETAPKDGRFLLVYGRGWKDTIPSVASYDDMFDAWAIYEDGSLITSNAPPTHWMPLPEPPK